MGEVPIAYRFRPSDADVESAVRRIARERLSIAIAALEASGEAHAPRVHAARKEIKKLRALIRLVRPVFAEFDSENAVLRDTARALSQLRDSDVMVETAATLDLPKPTQKAILRHLQGHRDKLLKRKAANALCAEAAAALGEARARARHWTLTADGFRALAPGLTRRLSRASVHLARAERDDAEALHDLRRDIKYHAHHLRLIEPLWPAILSARRREAERLSELLGKRHDLDVLALKLEGARFGSATLTAAHGAIAGRRSDLDSLALPLAHRLLAEAPGAFAARWEPVWKLWRPDATDRLAQAAE